MDHQRMRDAVTILNTLLLDTMVGLRSLDIFSAIDDKTPLSDGLRGGL